MLDDLGYEGAKYSLHSGKRGAATYAASIGMAEVTIQQVGDWKSARTARLYIENNTPLRIKRIRQIQDAI